MRHTTIRSAMQRVADSPEPNTDDLLVLPVHELICRTLFDIANNPMQQRRGAMNQANVARGIILDRLVGRRAPGSHPAVRKAVTVAFTDLTGELGR